MHVNQKIDLLVRASRLYCHNMYREYDPKYYPTIKNVVLNLLISCLVQNELRAR